MDVTSFTLFALMAAGWRWKERKDSTPYSNPSLQASDDSPEVMRLRTLLTTEMLVHPFLRYDRSSLSSSSSADGPITSYVANFCDLASACAQCCGVPDPHEFEGESSSVTYSREIRKELVELLGGTTRQHIILILCDGMGNNILDQHLPPDAFLRKFNQPDKLRAVFPSTTPAALTTLATAQWPGQHGAPGWDLREVTGCEFPGKEAIQETIQLRVLAPKITNVRTGTPATSYRSIDDVFVAKPWARSIRKHRALRRMMYISAYNGDDFPSWYQGNDHETVDNNGEPNSDATGAASIASDFSSWQMAEDERAKHNEPQDDPFAAVKILETAQDTLGEPDGSKAAIQYFADGVDAALSTIETMEATNQKSFQYLYTAHPDKHMHALGTDHEEVAAVVRGINAEVERLCNTLVKENYDMDDAAHLDASIDVTVVVTADHGHITVAPDDMIQLPTSIIECLEYANIGVHGKGRHAYLHCKSGLQMVLRKRWRACEMLTRDFLLLTIEEAAEQGLFGPHKAPLFQVRPRLGDYVAIATTRSTLLSAKEHSDHCIHCQGAHGSLLPEEMKIPFVLFTTSSS